MTIFDLALAFVAVTALAWLTGRKGMSTQPSERSSAAEGSPS